MPIDLAAAARRGAVLLCALAGAAPARDSGTDRSLLIERAAHAYVVNADGSYTLTVDEVRRIVHARAVAPHSRYAITYQGARDRIGALAAYTEKPDGRRIALGPAQIERQPDGTDARTMLLRFPEVAAGDRLVLHYVLKRGAALFPGQFEDLSSSPFYRQPAFSLSYDLPEQMPLYADALGFEPAAPAAAAPGRRRYAWRYQSGPNRRIEAGSVSYLDYGKRLAVSTFADYGAFARAFEAGAAGRAAPTPEIAALAARLTRGLPDARARALALADWVRREVRHTGAEFGPGGVVPEPAASVLARRHGDGKDHAILLEALLSAAGIDSSPALLNNGAAFRLPRTPTLGILNHMITYVPGLDLYLDASATSVAPGYLPDQLLGKPVLLTRTGQLARTPAFQPDRARNVSEFHVGRGGKTLFRVIKTNTGAGAEPYRQALRASAPAERDALVGRILRENGQRGYGVLDPGRLEGDGDAYQMVMAGISENFARLPGPTGVASAYNFWGGILEATAALTRETARGQDFVCPAVEYEEESVFVFAPGLRILALPAALSLRRAGFDYRAAYARSGNRVTVRRRFGWRPATAPCAAAAFGPLRPLFERVRRDLTSQIVVR